ncbi:protocadherin-9-like isoform X1 [Mytilus trossulus]|uniref:protocadherin-9-like isoform X1 n=1 Tax=Mytilus trossulus TaxID=6551 RepID=UPI003006D0AF
MEKFVITYTVVCCFVSHVLSLDLSYTIPEERNISSYIGNVANDSSLNQSLNVSERNNMKYTILDGTYASYFNVNERTSSLYISKRLDRESLQECEFSTSCDLPIDIVAQSIIGTFFKKIKVKITITDINDHEPKFPESSMSLELSEAFVVGSSSPIVGAVDMDSGDNSVQKYSLKPKDTPFTLNFVKYVDGSSSVSLVVSKKLDRETVDGYQLQIIAEDGGNPIFTGTLDLTVIITDINDNPPSFNQSTYSISVREDTAVSSTVFNVKATDPDLNENGMVTYKLSPHQSDNIKQIFAVNRSTGSIFTLKPLVYTPGEPYKIIVEANDGATIPLMSQATIFVTVLDSGNDAPVINVNLLSNTDMAKISENASVGAAVAHIAVSDDDTDKNGDVTCSIQHDVFRLEKITGEENEYKVVVSKTLDREKTEIYKVIIVCEDAGSPPKNSTAEFNVKVLDENDHRPTFQKYKYEVVISENDFVGASIVQVSALDLDLGKNAEIVYFIEPSAHDFRIDAETGNIRANFILDREKVPYMEFRVLSKDKGSPSLTGTAVVTVNLTDVNDNPPKFNKSVYVMHAKENEEPGLYVGEVIAHDFDSGKNAVVNFVAEPEIEAVKVLTDGSIFTSLTLDRESRPHGYSFNVIAYDGGNPSLNSTAHVTVFVVDENDNDPVIKFPTAENGTVQMVYEKSTNSVITYVEATDNDTDNNAVLTFSILQHEVQNTFKINSKTGEITLARALTANDMKSFIFTVQVEDGGTPKRRDKQNLTIIISSNKPLVLPRKEAEKDNALIVVVIVCVTVILSGAIIMGIFLIRRMDKKKKNKKRNTATPKNDKLYDSIHKNGTIHRDDVDNEKKVSFSTHATSNGIKDKSHMQLSNGHRQEEVTQTVDRMMAPSPSSSKYGRSAYSGKSKSQSSQSLQNMQMNRLQLHQSNLQTLSIPQNMGRKHEDNHSETSGETNDSGRGGSESDIHSSAFNHSAELDYMKNRYSPVNSPGRPLLTKENMNKLMHPKERYRSQNQQCLVQNNCHRQYTHGGSSGPPYKNNVHWNPISNVLNGSMATIDDYDDDTTTSGSYVVDDQELDLDFNPPQDCVV